MNMIISMNNTNKLPEAPDVDRQVVPSISSGTSFENEMPKAPPSPQRWKAWYSEKQKFY